MVFISRYNIFFFNDSPKLAKLEWLCNTFYIFIYKLVIQQSVSRGKIIINCRLSPYHRNPINKQKQFYFFVSWKQIHVWATFLIPMGVEMG